MNHRAVVLAARGDGTLNLDPRPTAGREVESEDVVQAAAAPVAAEDVEAVLVGDARRATPLSGLRGGVGLHLAPSARHGDAAAVHAGVEVFSRPRELRTGGEQVHGHGLRGTGGRGVTVGVGGGKPPGATLWAA